MIEGGVAGGSAAHHADQRRTVAARLESEASWLDAVAEDERATGQRLQELSQPYAILHDLKLPGTQGNIDHVVVGPGGAFVVATRRFADQIEFREGTLHSGGRSLQAELAGVAAIAAQLTDVLGTPVVPVVGFHGNVLSVTAPPQVDSVLVCATENLVRVITRASHTLLPPHRVTDVLEKALPLLFNPGSTPRHQLPADSEAPTLPPSAIPTLVPIVPIAPIAPIIAPVVTAVAPVAPPAMSPLAPPPAPPPPAFAALAGAESASEVPSVTVAPAVAPTTPVDPTTPVAPTDAAAAAATAAAASAAALAARTAAPLQPAAPARHKRSKGFVLAVVVSLCLVAGTLGAAANLVLKDDAPPTSVSAPMTTAVFVEVTGPLAANLPAPTVAFSAVCPAAGSGWQLVATWPGDIDVLAQYDVELQNADGTWTALAPLLSASVTAASLEGYGPNVTVTVRITAVLIDGSRSANQPTPFTTPTSPC